MIRKDKNEKTSDVKRVWGGVEYDVKSFVHSINTYLLSNYCVQSPGRESNVHEQRCVRATRSLLSSRLRQSYKINTRLENGCSLHERRHKQTHARKAAHRQVATPALTCAESQREGSKLGWGRVVCKRPILPDPRVLHIVLHESQFAMRSGRLENEEQSVIKGRLPRGRALTLSPGQLGSAALSPQRATFSLVLPALWDSSHVRRTV